MDINKDNPLLLWGFNQANPKAAVWQGVRSGVFYIQTAKETYCTRKSPRGSSDFLTVEALESYFAEKDIAEYREIIQDFALIWRIVENKDKVVILVEYFREEGACLWCGSSTRKFYIETAITAYEEETKGFNRLAEKLKIVAHRKGC